MLEFQDSKHVVNEALRPEGGLLSGPFLDRPHVMTPLMFLDVSW